MPLAARHTAISPDERSAQVASRCSPDWRAVTLAGVIFDLVGEACDHGGQVLGEANDRPDADPVGGRQLLGQMTRLPQPAPSHRHRLGQAWRPVEHQRCLRGSRTFERRNHKRRLRASRRILRRLADEIDLAAAKTRPSPWLNQGYESLTLIALRQAAEARPVGPVDIDAIRQKMPSRLAEIRRQNPSGSVLPRNPDCRH
jgi:hypothetical protein